MKRTKYNKKEIQPYNQRTIAPTNTPLHLNYNISLQESLFISEYTKDWDVLRALKDSGLYPTKKVSQKEAREIGNDLLKNPAITAALNQAVQYKVQRNLISKDQIITHMARIAFADTAGLFNNDGTLKEIQEIPYELRCCISEIKSKTQFGKGADGNTVVTGYLKELKLESKITAMKELLKEFTPQIQMKEGDTNIQNNYIDLSGASLEDIQTVLRLTGQDTESNEDILELEKIEECSLQN